MCDGDIKCETTLLLNDEHDRIHQLNLLWMLTSIAICEITNRKVTNDIKICICLSLFYITQTLYKDIIL